MTCSFKIHRMFKNEVLILKFLLFVENQVITQKKLRYLLMKGNLLVSFNNLHSPPVILLKSVDIMRNILHTDREVLKVGRETEFSLSKQKKFVDLSLLTKIIHLYIFNHCSCVLDCICASTVIFSRVYCS